MPFISFSIFVTVVGLPKGTALTLGYIFFLFLFLLDFTSVRVVVGYLHATKSNKHYQKDFEDSYAETWGLWEVPTVFHWSIHTMLDHVDFFNIFYSLSLIPVIHIACGILHIDAPCRQLFRSFLCTL